MFFQIILTCLLIQFTNSVSENPILIVVSYDAFRHELFTTEAIPNLNRLRKLGTYADRLINVFPTKTFPNHHSIATGLYPEVHGVVDNVYFNRTTKMQVRINYEMFHYDDGIVPIWRRNEDYGRRSGSMMWPGGCYSYQGKNITYCQDYDPKLDWFKRVDMVMDWLTGPQPANLIMMYFEEPDTDAHIYGITSDVVDVLMRKLDNITLYLEQQLKVNNLLDRAHVVHLSDHGMVDMKPPHFINTTQFLVPNTYMWLGVTPILQFFPNAGHYEDVYWRLKDASQTNHFKVYRKKDLPERWHYKNNNRTAPIVVVAELGYGLDDAILYAQRCAVRYNFTVTNDSTFGTHGYDNIEKEMHAFFMIRGPKVKVNHKVPPFNTVDLFNLFCQILELPLVENNGTLANIVDILNTGNGGYSLSAIITFTAGGLVLALILVGCAAILTLLMIKRQQSITTTAALNKRFPQTFHSSVEAQHLLEPEDA